MGTRGRLLSAVSLSPACSLEAHSLAGMNAWMNANAGAAVAPTNIVDTTKIRSILRMAFITSLPIP